MSKIITRETNVVQGTPNRSASAQTVSSEEKAEKSETVVYLIYFFLGAIEVLLVSRFFLKITGANPISGFVRFIYSLTQMLVLPFEGIFHRAVTPGLETTAVFEPSTLVAMFVYLIIAWGIIQLIAILAGKPQDS